MAKRSPLFMAGAGLLLVLNLGLGWAVVDQRQSSVSAEAQSRLEVEKSLISAHIEAGEAVVKQKDRIESNNRAISQQVENILPRLYDSGERSSLEMDITRAVEKAKGKKGKLSLQQIAVSMTEAGDSLRRWTYSVSLRGKANALPPLSQQIYQNKRLAILGRVAATSPNFSFKDLDMVMDIHYYEAVEAPSEAEVAESVRGAFVVKTSPLAEGVSGKVEALHGEVGKLHQTLDAMNPELLRLAKLEADTTHKKQMMTAYAALSEESKVNQQIIKESLPKLYLRIRSSTLGGAAILVDGDTVTFPEYSGED